MILHSIHTGANWDRYQHLPDVEIVMDLKTKSRKEGKSRRFC